MGFPPNELVSLKTKPKKKNIGKMALPSIRRLGGPSVYGEMRVVTTSMNVDDESKKRSRNRRRQAPPRITQRENYVQQVVPRRQYLSEVTGIVGKESGGILAGKKSRGGGHPEINRRRERTEENISVGYSKVNRRDNYTQPLVTTLPRGSESTNISEQ
ncbi:hypothetical protein BGX38DRAFT_1152448 [Terfezia claveryi]|nr:hypothetical protein BGX38DRAFT_1152448 [Terfezia claveryi]